MRKVEIKYTVCEQVHVSDNMNWIAIDEDGKIWAFENEPLPSYHEYDREETGKGVWIAPGDFEYISSNAIPDDWENTLIKI